MSASAPLSASRRAIVTGAASGLGRACVEALHARSYAVAALDARGLDPLLPAMKAHGVPWLRRHLHGEISLEEAVAGGQRDTRQYAKRQHTWFRHQLPDWSWLTVEEAPVVIERLMQMGSA